jgi:peroxiredoxin
MTRSIIGLAAVALLLSAQAKAELKVGDKAPDFVAQAALGGKEFTFSLADALKKGPVVLYFYPKSFTKGCTVEAHEFADAAASFAKSGASLIGMSADDIKTQQEFSTMECRDKFPVAADPDLKVIRAYDSVMVRVPATAAGVADRTSYVIAPDHSVLYVYSALSPDKHVENTLAVVREWRRTHPAGPGKIGLAQ